MDSTISLLDILDEHLKPSFERAVELKKTPGVTSEELIGFYKTQLLPTILRLRGQNRYEKDLLEEKSKRVGELTDKFKDLQETCDSLSFMVSTFESNIPIRKQNEVAPSSLKHLTNGVSSPKTNSNDDSFDLEAVIKLDHETRMRILDEEEKRRQELQEKLAKANLEIKSYEATCSKSSSKINDILPHIKQFIDRVGPTTHQLDQEASSPNYE